MPLLLVIILHNQVIHAMRAMIMTGCTLVLGTSEHAAVLWLPAALGMLVFAIITVDDVEPKPPYSTKATQLRYKSSWLGQLEARVNAVLDCAIPSNVPNTYSRHKFRPYQSGYCSASQRRKGRNHNRSLAMAQRLVLLSCMTSAVSGARLQGFDSDSKLIAIDNCASRCLTMSRSDFVPGTIKPCNVQVTGVGGVMKCKVQGTVQWSIEDDQGRVHDLLVPETPLCPGLPHRLLSPQHWAQEIERQRPGSRLRSKSRAHCSTTASDVALIWGSGRFVKTIPLNDRRNVAIMSTKTGIVKYNSFASTVDHLEPDVCCFISTGTPLDPGESTNTAAVVSDDEESTTSQPTLSPADNHDAPSTEKREPQQLIDFDNQPEAQGVSYTSDDPVSNDQAELYRLHVRHGHLPFSKLRAKARRGDIPSRLQHVDAPICAACQFGKATRKPWRTKKKNRHLRRAKEPGECVSVDQVESRAVGFVAQLKGRLTRGRYRVATIFVDHHSRLGYVHLQKDSSSAETLKAKHAFERYARDHGVTIKHYHADNGRFVDNAWKESLLQENQTITHCGVNAHWQNGIAERRIRDLKEQSRTMLLHAEHHWPEAITTSLWPYAMRNACQLFNDAPQLKGEHKDKTPFEMFTGISIGTRTQDAHTFGCPVYVTDNRIQAGKSLPAWMSRARVGINLGISPTHARNVSLVLSLKTGLASPQFHVKHDDLFETTGNRAGGYKMPTSRWQLLAGFTKPEPKRVATRQTARSTNRTQTTDSGEPDSNGTDREDFSDGDGTSQGSDDEPTIQEVGESSDDETGEQQMGTPTETRTRSGRRVTETARMKESRLQRGLKWVAWLSNVLPVEDTHDEIAKYEIFAFREYDVQDRASDPIAFSATSDPDTMYWHQAMKQPDKQQFIQAAIEEVKSHVENDHFVLVDRSVVPKGTKVLPAVWSMKRKRRILTREIYKWKARMNCHGGHQVLNVNFWQTYCPTVNWFSIRIFLVISILQGWHTRQIDFVLAFPQADVECDIFMEIPVGFELRGKKKNYCLKLKKNLYGTKQAGRVWNQHLNKGLLELGFVASKIDPCVYYYKKTVFMVYVDDGIFAGPDADEIRGLIAMLQTNFKVTDEGDLREYLGVLVEKQEDGRTKLSQPQLIKQVLDDLWFNDKTKTKPTPAPGGQVLEREIDAESMNDDFHYRSVIGKANFLEKSTRPDVAVAVHQCARFSAEPKQSHADAVRYFGRYLKGTQEEGIYLDPKHGKSFECWVDADFLGQYVKGANDMHLDKMTAKSRTGYIITYAGCPITWGSRLQTESALSSTEAEYMAISEAFRMLLPMMDLIDEARKKEVPIEAGPPVVRCKAFEDNSGALELARMPKMRPRTRHINVKYHHFREAVAQGRISISHVPTEEQRADIMTKNLPRDQFLVLRQSILGW